MELLSEIDKYPAGIFRPRVSVSAATIQALRAEDLTFAKPPSNRGDNAAESRTRSPKVHQADFGDR